MKIFTLKLDLMPINCLFFYFISIRNVKIQTLIDNKKKLSFKKNNKRILLTSKSLKNYK